MHTFFSVLLLLLLSVGSANASAAENRSGSFGSITGRVTSKESGSYLIGAEVELEETHLRVITGGDGYFAFTNVRNGPHTLIVRYLGLEEQKLLINVEQGSTIRRDITLSPGDSVTLLNPYVVRADETEEARARNQQRTATTLKNIVSSDIYGTLPNQTVAEALRYLPGVSIDRDRGDGSTVTVRGMQPELNIIQLDGQDLPSGDGVDRSASGRATKLQGVPAELIGSIEVIKAPTPDMSANFIGGAVNLRTRSPFDFKKKTTITAKTQFKFNEINSGTGGLGTVNLFTKLGPRQNLGLGLSINAQNEISGIQDTVPTYYATPLTRNGESFPAYNVIDIRNRTIWRQWLGSSGAVEWRSPDERTTLTLKGYINDYNIIDDNHRYRVQSFPDPATLASRYSADSNPTRSTASLVSSVFRNLLQSSEHRVVESLGFDGKHTTQGGLTYKSTLNYINTRYLTSGGNPQFRWNNVPNVGWDRTRPEAPAVFGDVYQYDRFFLISNNSSEANTTEQNSVAQFDAEKPTRLSAFAITLKAGIKANHRNRSVSPKYLSNNYTGPLVYLPDFFEDGAKDYYQHGSLIGKFPSVQKVTAYLASNPQWSPPGTDLGDQEIQNRYEASEDIYGAYVMGTVQMKRTSIVAGLRAEETTTKASSVSLNQSTVPNRYTPTSGSGQYTNYFPQFLSVHRLTDKLQMRGAVTQSIARPSYTSLVPFENVNNILRTVSRGNPKLRPARAQNFDLSLEYYRDSSTILTLSGFQKEIKDFVYSTIRQETRTYTDASGPAGATVTNEAVFNATQPTNGAMTTTKGIEADFQVRLSFLPGKLANVSIGATALLLKGDSTFRNIVAGQEVVRKTGFRPNQSNSVYNWMMQYNGDLIRTRVAYTVTSKFPTSIGLDSSLDRWVKGNDILAASIILQPRGKQWSFFIQGENLTKPGRWNYQGNENFVVQFMQDTASVSAGINYRR